MSTSSSSAPIASPPTAMSATRSAPMRRRSPRATTMFPSTSRCRRPRSMRSSLPATRSRSRRAAPDEVLTVSGRDGYGQTATVTIAPAGTHAVNYAIRRDAGAARHGPHHRAGRSGGGARGAGGAISRAFCLMPFASSERELRAAIIATATAMNAAGINRGKSGNVSARMQRATDSTASSSRRRACRTTPRRRTTSSR